MLQIRADDSQPVGERTPQNGQAGGPNSAHPPCVVCPKQLPGAADEERTLIMISDGETPVARGPYSYDGDSVRALRDAMSSERLATYLNLARQDRRRALQIYTRNAALGSAFHGPLQAFEVTLRNTVNRSLSASRGATWYKDQTLLRPSEHRSVVKARESLRKKRKSRESRRVVAELNLGFWVALFSRKYDSDLWCTHLHKEFTPEPNRAVLHRQLDQLRTLRNRIAHHEPILQRDLGTDHEKLLWILRMLSPDTADWVAHHSRVPGVLAQSSHVIDRF